MATHEVDILQVKTDDQGAKFVKPSESAFAGKAIFVDYRVEQASAAQFDRVPVAPVFGDIGNDVVIETDFPSIAGVESTVRVEESPGNRQAKALDGFEGRLN